MRIGLSSETETSGTRVGTNCGGELAELTDKVAGSILGQASGDAVGFIVAGCEREARGNRITSFFAEHVVGERPLGYGAQYSDNTQLARELAISICEQRGFVGDACAKRITDLFVAGGLVGPGRATMVAMERLRAGVPRNEAAEPPGAEGNGAAMRAFPIGWLCDPASAELVLAASNQAMITHRDSDAIAGAVVIAGAVAEILNDRVADAGLFLDGLTARIEAILSGFAEKLRDSEYFLDLPFASAHAVISEIGGSAGDWKGTISPHVVQSVVWSIWSYLRGWPHYSLVRQLAISGFGDTDTCGAMAGAMIGAEFGLPGLPADSAESIHDRGQWQATELVALASHIVRLRRSECRLDRS